MFRSKKTDARKKKAPRSTVEVSKHGATSRLGVLEIVSGYVRTGDKLYVYGERRDQGKGRIILYMYGPNRSYACSAVLRNGNFHKGDFLCVEG